MTTRTTETRPLLQRSAVTAVVAAAISAAVATLLFPLVTSACYAWGLTVSLAGAAVALAVIDIRTHRLPNRYVSAIASAGLVQAAAAAIASHDPTRVWDSLIAATAVGAAYVLLGLVGWFGFGDAKFAAALTITVAIYAGLAALYVLPLAILFAAIGTLICQVAGRVTRTRPHGPAVGLAAVCIMTAAAFALPAMS